MAYTAADAPGKLTVVANWVPFEDPAGGPNFYRLDDRARFWINVDDTGDGKPDVRYLSSTRCARSRARFGYAASFAHFPIVGLCGDCTAALQTA